METLRVTVIGKDIFKIMERIFEDVELNTANKVSNGMLGNLKLINYEFELEEVEVIRIRKSLMQEIQSDNKRLMGLFAAGDWMRIFVIEPFTIGTNPSPRSRQKQAP